MGARGSLIAGGLVLFLALGGGVAFVVATVHSHRLCEGPSPNWHDPGGVQVAGLEEAAPYLAFTPVVPRALGPAAKLLVDANKPDLSAKSHALGVSAARVRDILGQGINHRDNAGLD